jgi:hypothetical protein
MNIKKVLYSEFGKYVISILLGLGLASLFRKSCHDKTCLSFVGPTIDKVEGQVFEFGGKCYKYKAKAKKCESDKKKVRFA